MLCARGGDGPTAGSASATASEANAASRAGTTGHVASPNTRMRPDQAHGGRGGRRLRRRRVRRRGGGGRDDWSAAPMSPWPSPAGQRQCTRSTFLAPCNLFYGKSVGRQGQKLAGPGGFLIRPDRMSCQTITGQMRFCPFDHPTFLLDVGCVSVDKCVAVRASRGRLCDASGVTYRVFACEARVPVLGELRAKHQRCAREIFSRMGISGS